MQRIILFVLTFFISISLFISCEDALTEPEVGTNILTMVHFGVDWSEGIAATADGSVIVDNSDGETVAWCPGNAGEYGTGIWYRSAKDHIYRVGPGDLNDVTGVDISKWSNDVCATPLKNGDVWVAETMDGYVAFKVLNAPTDSTIIANDLTWSVEVEYKFSTTIGF